jgi:hypothetical protein
MMKDAKPWDLVPGRGIVSWPPSPSPRPSPSGRGGRGSGVGIILTRWDFLPDWMTVPLSLGERVRVRGNNASRLPAHRTDSGIVELHQSSGSAGEGPR